MHAMKYTVQSRVCLNGLCGVIDGVDVIESFLMLSMDIFNQQNLQKRQRTNLLLRVLLMKWI